MINKFWKPNEPIDVGDYLLYLFLSLFAFIMPPLGMTLVIVLTYRRLRTIGIVNKFLAFILSCLIIPILGLWVGCLFLPMDITIYSLLLVSLIAFSFLILKKPKP